MNARFLASIRLTDSLAAPDRRLSERKLCRVTGLLNVEGFLPMRIRTVDLSMKGIALLLPLALPHGTVGDVHFHLYVNGLLKEFKAKVQISNTVFLCSDVRAGCRFVFIDESARKILKQFLG